MSLVLALFAQSFAYSVQRDLITDDELHVARLSQPAGPSLSIACGVGTDHHMVIDFRPNHILDDRYGGALVSFTNRVRFGDQAPKDVDVEYQNDHVLIFGRAATEFAQAAKDADRVVIEIVDAGGRVLQIPVPLTGAAEAIGKVEAACRPTA